MEPALLEEEDLPDVPLDELRLARIKKAAQFMDAVWEMDFFLSPTPVQDKRGERPYYPYMTMTVDHRSGFIFGTDLAPPESYLIEFPLRFLSWLNAGLTEPFYLAGGTAAALHLKNTGGI